AIERVYGAALRQAGLGGRLACVEDPREGLVAEVDSPADDAALNAALGGFPRPWRRAA
ncbi:MAG: hypothetical protein ACK4WC_15970, partial [Rubrimonas sp.]